VLVTQTSPHLLPRVAEPPFFREVGFAPDFIGYSEALELQKQVHSEVVALTAPDTVLLLEHQPVYTAGKRTESHELPFDGSEFVESDRGGKITWHGPGQLIGYPIMRLPDPIDVVAYVRYLESSIIRAMSEFGVIGLRVPGRTGVWVSCRDRFEKVAAIGIRVSEKVTMHGFAVNCNNDLRPFENIVACGIDDAKVTSMSRILSQEITPRMFADVICWHLGEIPNGRKKP